MFITCFVHRHSPSKISAYANLYLNTIKSTCFNRLGMEGWYFLYPKINEERLWLNFFWIYFFLVSNGKHVNNVVLL